MRDDETEDDGRLDTSPPARSCAAIGKDIDAARALLRQAEARMREVSDARASLAALLREWADINGIDLDLRDGVE